MENRIIIIGSGAAGLRAAIELAKNDQKSWMISDMPSERAQSVMAEGGINAALYTENDSYELHAEETYHAGRKIADMTAIKEMTKHAPEIIKDLNQKGMSFSQNEDGNPDVRAFGGQSVKRTFYAASNTGKQLMHTLIDQARKYEVEDKIRRMTGWKFLRLLSDKDTAYGCILINQVTQEKKVLHGKMIIASGGLGAMFGNATGSVKNTGSVSSNLFANGVCFANGEFIQYHPTTTKISSKNMLITEAVRGEGGRLYIIRDGKPYYFMEEKYPKLGNLMPRDVIAREEYYLIQEGYQIYLDMTHLDAKIQETKLKGVVEDCKQFLGLDPTKEPIKVEPGIHYFMGGIWVDKNHRTSMKNLYAAGECACQYHGANRLGGNSLLGALYGGEVAARSAIEDLKIEDIDRYDEVEEIKESLENTGKSYDAIEAQKSLQTILRKGLGIIREEAILQQCISKIDQLIKSTEGGYDDTISEAEDQAFHDQCLLGKAMLQCADARKESRGAHTRSDYKEESAKYEKQTIARLENGEIKVYFKKAGDSYED